MSILSRVIPQKNMIDLILKSLNHHKVGIDNVIDQYINDEYSNMELAKSISIIKNTVDKNKLVLCGIGKSFKICSKLVATLNSLNMESTLLHPAEAMHGDLGVIKPGDTLILVTSSGNTPELVNLLPHLTGINIILLTCNRSSLLIDSGRVDSLILIDLPYNETFIHGLPAPTISTSLSLILADSIILAIAQDITPSLDDRKVMFSKVHPGGAIGQSLKHLNEKIGGTVGLRKVGETVDLSGETADLKKIGKAVDLSGETADLNGQNESLNGENANSKGNADLKGNVDFTKIEVSNTGVKKADVMNGVEIVVDSDENVENVGVDNLVEKRNDMNLTDLDDNTIKSASLDTIVDQIEETRNSNSTPLGDENSVNLSPVESNLAVLNSSPVESSAKLSSEPISINSNDTQSSNLSTPAKNQVFSQSDKTKFFVGDDRIQNDSKSPSLSSSESNFSFHNFNGTNNANNNDLNSSCNNCLMNLSPNGAFNYSPNDFKLDPESLEMKELEFKKLSFNENFKSPLDYNFFKNHSFDQSIKSSQVSETSLLSLNKLKTHKSLSLTSSDDEVDDDDFSVESKVNVKLSNKIKASDSVLKITHDIFWNLNDELLLTKWLICYDYVVLTSPTLNTGIEMTKIKKLYKKVIMNDSKNIINWSTFKLNAMLNFTQVII